MASPNTTKPAPALIKTIFSTRMVRYRPMLTNALKSAELQMSLDDADLHGEEEGV